MNTKYSLTSLLLYLENKLPSSEKKEISAYLMSNLEILDDLISIIKIQTHTQQKKFFLDLRLDLEMLGDHFKSSSGDFFTFLGKKIAVFRGNEESTCYRYAFYETVFSLIHHIDDTWFLLINNMNTLTGELLDREDISSKKNLVENTWVSLERQKKYSLFLYDDHDLYVLEILI